MKNIYYPIPAAPAPVAPLPKASFGWGKALLFTLLGVVLTVGGMMLFFALAFHAPSNITLMRPAPTGKPDLSVSVTQDYINREISNVLAQNPISAGGVVEVNDVVVKFEPDSYARITTRVALLGREVDFTMLEKVSVQNNAVKLTLAEDPKIEVLGGLPLGILNGLLDEVNKFAANEITRQIVSVGEAKSCETGQPLGRLPTLTGVKMSSGVILADFSIRITP